MLLHLTISGAPGDVDHRLAMYTSDRQEGKRRMIERRKPIVRQQDRLRRVGDGDRKKKKGNRQMETISD